ncbi:tyrosine-type recombinase/integrase [Autumnicola musiva]|uniref:Tyrosine-type recombinase/integrase n=1 Tax=Autumnicola musiva TaxID=3075589 RepID=A0ABU3D628_9FLAO|nr:tyrosine-type recombinase/integrase [Zunongwangia sp. F117]MDT0676991.1 tyrosine-type recombinase/integrase [Zunongwangia sp. F117]
MSIAKIPALLRIELSTTTAHVIHTAEDVWTIPVGGINNHIHWNKLIISEELTFYFKLYVIHRLQTRSVATVMNGDYRMIIELNRKQISFPFNSDGVLSFLRHSQNYNLVNAFKGFYGWALQRAYKGFDSVLMDQIKEIKIKRQNPYHKIFLQQNFVTDEEDLLIRNRIAEIDITKCSWIELRNNIILNISYELAPRPSQFYLINVEDFISVKTQEKIYFSINLPMSKKRKSLRIEKRNRSISLSLGEKIEKLLLLYKYYRFPSKSLFLSNNRSRLLVSDYTSIIKAEMNTLNINKTPTDLRHHLAQSLADQGASAEVIAELMGHNSTLPARAYIAATPKIAEIKAKALGKNPKYMEIMDMMVTGKIIERKDALHERWIKGMIAQQYIGGIGSCGLPSNTSCPKNPVYACYTCIKFHPFKDGNHVVVKEELQKQAQYFVDIAENVNDLSTNRTVHQLEDTIIAVDRIITKISSSENGN